MSCRATRKICRATKIVLLFGVSTCRATSLECLRHIHLSLRQSTTSKPYSLSYFEHSSNWYLSTHSLWRYIINTFTWWEGCWHKFIHLLSGFDSIGFLFLNWKNFYYACIVWSREKNYIWFALFYYYFKMLRFSCFILFWIPSKVIFRQYDLLKHVKQDNTLIIRFV